jgi:flavin-dependent dehydrogenase
VAGIAAALETARAGLRTAVVEKTISTGGLATSGLVWFYPALCDASGRQVTFGAAEELLRLCFRYGPGRRADGARDAGDAATAIRSGVIFSPAAFVLALDEVLADAGVHLWFDTLACAPVMEGDRVVGVEVETKAGHGVFRAPCLIDATGDADICYRAGAACEPEGNFPYGRCVL